jgi:hypothetical protein
MRSFLKTENEHAEGTFWGKVPRDVFAPGGWYTSL